MISVSSLQPAGRLLLIGASRGLGLALASEFVSVGWHVTGTVRGNQHTGLHDLAVTHAGQIAIETLDIDQPDQIDSLATRLAERLSGQPFDMLFVNAGTTNATPNQPVGQVSTQDFIAIMTTNALSPMRVVDAFDTLVAPEGLIGIMSSGQGSIANNETGLRELYRGSKAALNQFMRCYDARQKHQRPLALIAPGWVRTTLGGPDARLSIEESIPGVTRCLMDHRSGKGLIYRDYAGRDVPW